MIQNKNGEKSGPKSTSMISGKSVNVNKRPIFLAHIPSSYSGVITPFFNGGSKFVRKEKTKPHKN